MKRRILYTMVAGILLAGSMSSCIDTFLDLQPLDQRTDVVYFKKASDFKEYANKFYESQLLGWKSPFGSIYDYMDDGSDLTATSSSSSISSNLGHGTIQILDTDTRWDGCYKNIRAVNILLERARDYQGSASEIEQYVSEAHFFRAYNYFYMLKFFGGVPVVTTPLDVDSPELLGARNSRYDVVELILSDLDNAIAGLPVELNIPSTEKGRISYYAAKAFKARVLLYEATWRMNNGTSTDYAGSAGPASNQVKDFIDETVRLCEEVMDNGGYELWNHNEVAGMNNMSHRYLFCLEDGDTNPAGLDKGSNKEFIIYNVYDQILRPGGNNINQAITKIDASRKLADMFLCENGLPITYGNGQRNPQFQGYANPGDEFVNRDYRMKSYLFVLAANKEIQNSFDDPNKVVLNIGRSGYTGAKFYNPERASLKESANYPILRLAEVYLNYAEAVFEQNKLNTGEGSISDAQLNKSINLLRKRAGVASLTNKLVADNGLDMLNEIRRERAVELYMEGFRFDDLKRWGVAETTLNTSRCGMVVGGQGYPTAFVSATGSAITSRYDKNTYVWGEELVNTPVGNVNTVLIEGKDNFKFSKAHYLWPLPQKQINMNRNLVQNPGY
ncbi:RagB/SusD family nutrient uptake outer membrane protein [uncultured Bacteroides sp.]|uniref:RagB/SusD family nutrient uptake outer membrane protein n=1 Tax=uncultured Bacteroides sp. TaxID=162156 RepID=UPI0025ED6FC0|nr:RagB/SusD family nutrient uptake outer membrane protein [uncultured Bacteroides sp.]